VAALFIAFTCSDMKMAKHVFSAFGKVNSVHILDKSLIVGHGIFSKSGIRNILQEVTEQFSATMSDTSAECP